MHGKDLMSHSTRSLSLSSLVMILLIESFWRELTRLLVEHWKCKRLWRETEPAAHVRHLLHRHHHARSFIDIIHRTHRNSNRTFITTEVIRIGHRSVESQWSKSIVRDAFSRMHAFVLVIDRMIFGVRCDVVQRVTVQRSLVIILPTTIDRVSRKTQVLVGPVGFNRWSLLNKTFLLLSLSNKRKQGWRIHTHTK